MTSREYTEVAFILVGICAGLGFHFASGNDASFSGETPKTPSLEQAAASQPARISSLRPTDEAPARLQRASVRADRARRARRARARARQAASARASAPASAPRPVRSAPRTIRVSAPSPPRAAPPAPRVAPQPAPAPRPTKPAAPAKSGGGTKQFDDSG